MNKKIDTVFLGGSESVGRLNDETVRRLHWFIDAEANFIVGDGAGADLAFQSYLHSIGYRNVTVYYSGDKCGFNVGGWDERYIPEGESEYRGVSFRSLEMIEVCSFSFILWDGYARETRIHVRELKWRGKPVILYRSDIDDFRIHRGMPAFEGRRVRLPSEKKRKRALKIFHNIYGLRNRYDGCERIDSELLEDPHFAEDAFEAVKNLPDNLAAVLLASLDCTIEEIAERFEMPPDAARETCQRAWTRVRNPRYSKILAKYVAKYDVLKQP